jgi:hypothetical protein
MESEAKTDAAKHRRAAQTTGGLGIRNIGEG